MELLFFRGSGSVLCLFSKESVLDVTGVGGRTYAGVMDAADAETYAGGVTKMADGVKGGGGEGEKQVTGAKKSLATMRGGADGIFRRGL